MEILLYIFLFSFHLKINQEKAEGKKSFEKGVFESHWSLIQIEAHLALAICTQFVF